VTAYGAHISSSASNDVNKRRAGPTFVPSEDPSLRRGMPNYNRFVLVQYPANVENLVQIRPQPSESSFRHSLAMIAFNHSVV